MQKKAILLTLVTCIFGAFGHLFRWLQLMLAFEEDTGLAIPGSKLAVIVVAVCLLAAVTLYILVRRLSKYEAAGAYPEAFRGRSIFYTPVALIIGITLAVGAVLTMTSAVEIKLIQLQRILGAFAVCTAAAFVALALGTRRPKLAELSSVISVVPVLFSCFWLIVCYKENSQDPVIWSFAIEIIAIASVVLAFYYIAGFMFNKAAPIKTIFICEFSAFLCMTSLSDSGTLPRRLLLGATAAMLMFFAFTLTSNLTERKTG